ncbi:vanadium-dependent haloperoxidase [Anaerobacillus sp. MEB173]|uniref:vanadium-dependent haloperoxidase n=1 Tax=Anaerobacillus sp. MEB173 TaxID=3383345 RepID=UPI003F8FF59A
MNKQHPKKRRPPKWSKLNKGKLKPIEPTAGSWPMQYFRRIAPGMYRDRLGRKVSFKLRNPYYINFTKELELVKKAKKQLTTGQIDSAKYFGFGPPTKQWTPIIDRLIDTYEVSPVRSARILGVAQAAMNDAMVITWDYKYILDIARPNQLDPELETELPTPHFPAYPSGHSVFSGCAEVILSYFFPAESNRLKELAEEGSESRLYAGVHFPVDNHEGLRLGRQIGKHIVSLISKQRDSSRKKLDVPYRNNKHAILPPPPYEQVISYPPESSADERKPAAPWLFTI